MSASNLAEPIYRFPPVYKREEVSTPLSQTIGWGLSSYSIPQEMAELGGADINLAILDTGVDTGHPDLVGNLKGAKDFTGSVPEDRDGHGTHCCGVAFASNNDQGIVGVASKVNGYSYKILDDDGVGYERAIIAGIEAAGDDGMDVISGSFGSSRMSRRIRDALLSVAYPRGPVRVMVFAAGNDGVPNSLNYPAALVFTTAVGAHDQNRRRARFSSMGEGVTISAPGVDVLSTYIRAKSLYAVLSGTSMATPFVSGFAALYLAMIKRQKGTLGEMNPMQFNDELQKTATDAGEPGRDPQFGWGFLNPQQMLANNPPVPPQEQEIEWTTAATMNGVSGYIQARFVRG